MSRRVLVTSVLVVLLVVTGLVLEGRVPDGSDVTNIRPLVG